MNNKPDFLIIGAQKAGSTWIYDVLKEHSQVFLPDRVELLYFNKEKKYRNENLNNYLDNFASSKPGQRVGEKTPGYFWSNGSKFSSKQPPSNHNKNIPESVCDLLGSDVQLLLSLRHPISRAISAYGHHGKRDRIPVGSTLVDNAERLGIVDIGFYAAHLHEWLKYYPISSFCTLLFESDIVQNPLNGYNTIVDFLSIENEPLGLGEESNKGVDRKIINNHIAFDYPGQSSIDAKDISFLLNVYQKDIEELKSMLELDFSVWDLETEKYDHFCRDLRNSNEVFEPTNRREKMSETVVEVDKNNPNLSVLLAEYGLDASNVVCKHMPDNFVFEQPARLSNMMVHGDCSIGSYSYTVDGHMYATHIGRYCSIASNVNIGQFNHPMNWLSTNPFQYENSFRIKTGKKYIHDNKYSEFKVDPGLRKKAISEVAKKTIIGNDVWIGHKAVINAGVTIGDGAIIGAGAVVTRDVPPFAVVAGVPAKVLKYRFSPDVIERILLSEWWKYSPWQLIQIDFSDIDEALKGIKLIGDAEDIPVIRLKNKSS